MDLAVWLNPVTEFGQSSGKEKSRKSKGSGGRYLLDANILWIVNLMQNFKLNLKL